ncbi:hypothetical protein D3C85_1400750 [compost metagenome]
MSCSALAEAVTVGVSGVPKPSHSISMPGILLSSSISPPTASPSSSNGERSLKKAVKVCQPALRLAIHPSSFSNTPHSVRVAMRSSQ